MKEKEVKIIETAINLFAQKGFSQTSIQEIATECGISKGAFYTYFKSKETLLPAIFTYYYEKMRANVEAIEEQNLPPREKLIRQLTVLYESLIENKEFIIMQSRETAIPLNESVKKLMYKIQLETYQFYRESLMAIYGEKIVPFLWDLSVMLQGLFQSYIRILFFTKEQFNLYELSSFIIERMDDIVAGILTKNSRSILTESKMEMLLKKTCQFIKNEKIDELLIKMKEELGKVKNDDLNISFDVLESEIKSDTPRHAVIQGMLSNFKELPQFDAIRKEIAAIYHLK